MKPTVSTEEINEVLGRLTTGGIPGSLLHEIVKAVLEASLFRTWELGDTIPSHVHMVDSPVGRWTRQRLVDSDNNDVTDESPAYWAHVPVSEKTLLKEFGPVYVEHSTVPKLPPGDLGDETKEELKAALTMAQETLEMIFNGKQNRARVVAAEARCRKAAALL